LDQATRQPLSEDVLRKMPVGTEFLVEVENIGNDPFYFNQIDIEPGNKTTLNLGKDVYANKLIDVGRKQVFPTKIGEPYGLEQFKFIATSTPVDFSSLATMGTEIKTRSGGDESALAGFIGASVSGNTRGFSSDQELGATIKSFVFEIVKKK